MKASAVVHAVSGHRGVTRFETLRSDPPLVLRPTPDALYLVGGAAGPLGGDDLNIEIAVGADAQLHMRSAAAALALPGPSPSRMSVSASLAVGAHLDWSPEPLVSVVHSDHRQLVHIDLAEGATLRWRESVVLGRSGEPPGSIRSVLRLERSGRVVTHQELRFGEDTDGWDGPAVLDSARAVVSELFVGDSSDLATTTWRSQDARCALFEIESDVWMRTALATDHAAALAALATP